MIRIGDTNKVVQKKYLDLPQGDNCQVMYVWIDGSGEHVRGKTKTMTTVPLKASECPNWNYDGSSTNQAEGHDSDVYIVPVSLYPDPFRGGNNKIVLCETFDKHKQPLATNRRSHCKTVMDKAVDHHPWFGIEQEFTILDQDGHPFGWPKRGFPGPQGPYYCGVGTNNVFGRDLIESTYRACMYANLTVSGSNAEVMPGQWEFQIGPCEGISMGDELWVARYILHRVAEDYGVVVSLDPKPIAGDWNGAGCHTNYSTEAMRQPGGMAVIDSAIEKMKKKHLHHIGSYDPNLGEDNKRRLTGAHETAVWSQFTSGVAHRGASIRIPRQCAEDGYGYLEDRRPSSNCDPYDVTRVIVETTILDM